MSEATLAIIARLQQVCTITRDEYNYPSHNDQQIWDAAKLNPSPCYRFVGGTLELVPVVGMGATLLGWTDRHPYEVVRVVSPDCVIVRAMAAEGGLKKDHKFSPGGFCGHVHDQETAQEWKITSKPDGRELRIRRTKSGWRNGSEKFMMGRAVKFHDYNF
jgi:hypothetical protein